MSHRPNSEHESQPESQSESSQSSGRAPVTRRDALITAASAATLAKVGSGRVTSQTGDITVNVGNFESTVTKYEQFSSAEVTELAIGSDTTVTVRIAGTTDSRIQLQGFFQVNTADKIKFADQIRPLPPSQEEITFTHQDSKKLWKKDPSNDAYNIPDGVTVDSDTDFDFEWASTVEPQYRNLRPPETISETPDDLARQTELKVIFEAISDTAEIQEKQVFEFDLHIGHDLGMNSSFLTGFASEKPPSWPDNWDTI